MVFSLFGRYQRTAQDKPKEFKRKYKNSHIAQEGRVILARQKNKLEDIGNSLSINEQIYSELYEPLFINICALAQCVPASEEDHHSNLCGYLDHIFECVVLALRKSEGVIYGSEREDKIMRKRDIFTYAVTVAALTHDLGKLVTDIEFHNVTNEDSHSILFGPMEPGTEFLYRFYPARNYSDHRAASCSALLQVVPKKGMKWLHEDSSLFRELIHTISGDYKLAGKLGDIVREADQHSTQKNLGRTATKFASRISTTNTSNAISNTNELALHDAQNQQAQENQNNRAAIIANAVVDILSRHQDLSNGKNINEKGGLAWVSRDYIYMVTPRCFEIIKSILHNSGNGIKITMAHVCYQILFDAGFIEKINGQTSDYLNIDPEDWNKTMRFVKFKREKIDPEFKFPETEMKIINPKEVDKKTESKDAESLPNKPIDSKNQQDSNTNTHDITPSVPPIDDSELPPEAHITDLGENSSVHELLSLDESDDQTFRDLNEKETNAEVNPVGELFLDYLKESLNKKAFHINKPKAPIHIVEGAMFLVSPMVFKKFIQSSYGIKALKHTKVSESEEEMKQVKAIQFKLFECNLHYKDVSLQNILYATVTGAKRTSKIAGFLLKKEVLTLITDERMSSSKNVFIQNPMPELK